MSERYRSEPPSTLTQLLFPWVEEEQQAYARRLEAKGRLATDICLKNFLALLVKLRRVLLQDAAVLYAKYPGCAVFGHAPFNMEEFRVFSGMSASIIEEAEQKSQLEWPGLPDTLQSALRGALHSVHIGLERDSQTMYQHQLRVEERLGAIDALVQMQFASKAQRKHAQSEFKLCE